MPDSATSEQSQPGDYIAALTGMRGFAALLVFGFHYSFLHPGIRFDLTVPWVGHILQFPLAFGFVGVDVFFVLSGFLLSLPFARFALGSGDKPRLGRYFSRRLLRVFPAYYAQLFLILLVGSWFSNWTALDLRSLLAHLFMFFNIGSQPVSPMVGVWWTLPVEMGFYLLLPLLAPFMRLRWWLPLLFLAIVLGVVYRAWAAAHFGATQPGYVFLAAAHLPGTLAEFMLGGSAALLAQAVNLGKIRKPPAWILEAGFVLGLLLPALWLQITLLGAGDQYWLGHWSMLLAPLAIGLPLSAAVLCLYWGSRLGKLLLANRLLWFIGLISYSLYLWHFVVMLQLIKLVGEPYAGWSHWLTFPLCLALVTAMAALSYYLVERPFFPGVTFRKRTAQITSQQGK